VSPAGTLGRGGSFQRGVNCPLALRRLPVGGAGSRFTHCVGKRKEIIRARLRGAGRHCQPQYFPAARYRQGACMLLAQIVAMWFSVGGQRPKNSSGIRIDIRERGYRGLAAG
jgi:hypothetical protein